MLFSLVFEPSESLTSSTCSTANTHTHTAYETTERLYWKMVLNALSDGWKMVLWWVMDNMIVYYDSKTLGQWLHQSFPSFFFF